MAGIDERQPPDPCASRSTPDNARLKKLQQLVFERGVETCAIPYAAVDYLSQEMPIAEVRFIPLSDSPLQLLEQAGLQAATLWSFINQLPKRLDAVARRTFRQKFGNNPAFVFVGADGFLWIWHQTIAGCRIDPFPVQNCTTDVWVVGYNPP
jgi:hypothetical protein